MNLRKIKDAVHEARDSARREAAQTWRCVKSRGTFVATANARGEQCRPFPEADAIPWRGTLIELNSVVKRVSVLYPEAVRVYIAGGYDGADTVHDLIEQLDYKPWASAWHVTVWERPGTSAV